MAIKDSFIAELKHEGANTRRMLERVPGNSFSFKPHEKSFPLGALAQHIANLPLWITFIMQGEEYDISIPFVRPDPVEDTAGLLDFFDKRLKDAIDVLNETSDEQMNGNWTFRRGDQVQFSLPRKVVLRSFVFNHIIHHRGQLSVYLRLLDVPVPGLYGPSADEK